MKRLNLYETVKIGGVYYPALPPSSLPSDGLPVSWGTRFGKKRGPKAPNLRNFASFEGPAWTPDVRSGARMRPPGLRAFLVRGAGRFRYVFDAIQFAYEISQKSEQGVGDWVSAPAPEQYFHVDIPEGWIICQDFSFDRTPGMATILNRTWRFGEVGTPLAGRPAATCSQSNVQNVFGAFDPSVHWFGGLYVWREHNVTGERDRLSPWINWRGAVDPNNRFTVRLSPSPSHWIEREPGIAPRYYPGAEMTVDPSRRPVGTPTGFNTPLPFAALPKRKNTGWPQQWTGTNGPPRPPRLPPTLRAARPPRGTIERKRRHAFAIPLEVAKEMLNIATESCDAVDAVWQTMPHGVKWTPGVRKACGQKALDIVRNVDLIDWDKALLALLLMYAEDKLWGKFFAASDAAMKNLGSYGWKLDGALVPKLPQGWQSV